MRNVAIFCALTFLTGLTGVGCTQQPQKIEGEYLVRAQNVAYGNTYVALEDATDSRRVFTLYLCGVHYELWQGELVRLEAEVQDTCWELKKFSKLQ